MSIEIVWSILTTLLWPVFMVIMLFTKNINHHSGIYYAIIFFGSITISFIVAVSAETILKFDKWFDSKLK